MSETQKDNRTQEWAERVGREAVALGFDVDTERHSWSEIDQKEDGSFSQVPDFRDRLTELACIAWVEDVTREVYGERFCFVTVQRTLVESRVIVARLDGNVIEDAPTLAEACIAAVRAMKVGE